MPNFLSRFKLKPFEIMLLIPVVIIVSLFIYGQFFTGANEDSTNQVNSNLKQVRIYEFWSKTCPHCADANKFLEPYTKNNEQIIWKKYELSKVKNQNKYEDVAAKLGLEDNPNNGSVPFIVIGDEPIFGFGSEQTTGQEIKNRVNYCLDNTCPDKTAEALGLDPLGPTDKEPSSSSSDSSSSADPNTTTQTTSFQNISASKANDLLTSKPQENLQVLDIRTTQEVNQGAIQSNIRNLDFYKDNFTQQLNQLDTDKTYLIYCNSGNRSSQALKTMKEQGFQKVYNLEGGIQEWTNAGYETVSVN